jgi:hypothetical protein
MASENEILAVIPRSATEQLQISISTYKGNKYLNMRIFYTMDDGQNWLPTKKGVTFGKDALNELQDAVERAKEILLDGEEDA